VARSLRACRYAAAPGSRPNSVRSHRNRKSRPGCRRSARSLFGLLTVVGHQTTPDKFLVSPPRLNHCLSIAVASPDVISYEFFPVTRAHVLTKAARNTEYIRQLTTTSLFSARFTARSGLFFYDYAWPISKIRLSIALRSKKFLFPILTGPGTILVLTSLRKV
jgi:hypothetical protein